MNEKQPEMPLEEALAKARQYAEEHKDKPSVSRTLLREIERLQSKLQKLDDEAYIKGLHGGR